MSVTAAGPARRPWIGGALLGAVLVLALALRLKGVAWGLPYSFVNVDESTVLPKAFAVARGGLDPGFFYYPSFFFYLVGGVYVLAAPVLWAVRHADPLAAGAFVVDPGPYFLLGRLVSVALGTASVYLVCRLGRTAFGLPVGLVAALFLAVAPLHVAYSHMAVTDVTATALSLLALLLFVQAAQGAGGRRLLAGALIAGLATSTKYNLGLLVLPGTVAAVFACREQVRARLTGADLAAPGELAADVSGPAPLAAGSSAPVGLAAAPVPGPSSRLRAAGRAALAWARPLVLRVYLPMLAAFLLGSPFVVLDARHFLHDFLSQNRIMARGWLGFEHAGNGLWYNLDVNLGGALGLVLLLLGLAGLVWAFRRRTRFDLVVAPYVIAYVAYVSTWKELADRYLLPVVPLLILLAVRLCLELAWARPALRKLAVPLVAVLLAGALAAPLSASLAFDRGLSGTDTRARARSWIEANVPAGSVIAVESYGPQLARAEDAAYYRAAGRTTPSYRVVRMQLPAPGVPNPSHTLAWLRAHDVSYVAVSSAVYDRVFAAAADYPALAAFYRSLDTQAHLVRTFSPGPGERGPTLKLYRL